MDGELAARLRAAIVARGVKQSWLAAEAGVPEETLSRITTGKTQNPGVYTVARIAKALGITVGELLAEKGFELTSADLETLAQFVTWASHKLPAKSDPRHEVKPDGLPYTSAPNRDNDPVRPTSTLVPAAQPSSGENIGDSARGKTGSGATKREQKRR
jgi:transcriptional regulator with XRE-family HTH domain